MRPPSFPSSLWFRPGPSSTPHTQVLLSGHILCSCSFSLTPKGMLLFCPPCWARLPEGTHSWLTLLALTELALRTLEYSPPSHLLCLWWKQQHLGISPNLLVPLLIVVESG